MNKILLLLDLDGTLIHSIDIERKDGDDDIKDVNMEENELYHGEFLTWFRPVAKQFVEEMQKIFLVGVWTAASADYAIPIVKELFEKKKPYVFFTYENCVTKSVPGGGLFPQRCITKPLSKIKYEKDLMLIVDDTPSTYMDNYGNSVPIKTWNGSDDDITLYLLSKYLVNTFGPSTNLKTIRHTEKRFWNS